MRKTVFNFKNIMVSNLIAIFIIAVIIAAFLVINSILDGYGNIKLFFYYLLVFFLVFFILNSILSLFGKLKKIPDSLFNNFFLLSNLFLSFSFFLITNYMIKFAFKSVNQPKFYYFPRNLSFIFALLFFIWLSSFKRNKIKNFIIILTTCIIFIYMFTYTNGGFSFRKRTTLNHDEPNVLLLTIESLRYDHLGCNGKKQVKTPNIDALAEKGIVFDNYFVQGSLTAISLPTLLTGAYPFNHGFRSFGQRYNPGYKPFLEELVKKDYFLKTDCYKFSYLFNKRRSSSIFIKIYDNLKDLPYIINDLFGDYFPFLFSQYNFGNTTSMSQTSRLLHRIRLNRRKKWFFWTHFYNNCHWPYGAPKHFINMYNKDGKSIKTSWSINEIRYLNDNPNVISDNILKGIKAAYKAEVSCIDSQIGLIINYLRRLNLFEKTIIIITGDHGELLGERRFIGHGSFLKDDLIHVPLIIHLIGSNYLKSGKRTEHFIEEVDIAPTILDLIGIEHVQKFDGRSLVTLFNSNEWHKKYIYSEVSELRGHYFRACYRSKRYKLVWIAGKNEFSFYDMILDPNEKENLISKFPELSFEMKQKLLDLVGCNSLNDLKPKIEQEIDKDLREKLKSLGYINNTFYF